MPYFRPFYLNSRSSSLFSLVVSPDKNFELTNSRTFIFIPPMMDEMNKSRSIVARQAKKLAEVGHHVLIFDLYGTGDSEGEYKEADLCVWQENILDAVSWSVDNGCKNITLWGLRSGCLLISDVLKEFNHIIDDLLLWQPILSGRVISKQIQRLNTARSISASAIHNDDPHYIQVSGYQLKKVFLDNIDALEFKNFDLSNIKTINWAQISVIESEMNQDHKRLVDQWSNDNIKVRYLNTVNELFWLTPEISIPATLINSTTQWYL